MNTAFFSPPVPILSGLDRPNASKSTSLSMSQLFDVELGLFLLSQLLPTASPNALPALMATENTLFADQPTWTQRQQKYLNRGRMILAHCIQPTIWNALIERYAAGTNVLSAYDVNRDCTRFGEKTVGFSRNRLMVLRKMLA